MKKGDRIPVTIGGHTVAQAEVEYVGEGQAILIVPATRVVMGIRVELDTPPVREATTETVITGVDRPTAENPNTSVATAQPTEVSGDATVTQAAVENTEVPPTPPAIVEAAGGNAEPATGTATEAGNGTQPQ